MNQRQDAAHWNGRRAFAALDLGTNNCRLLVAEHAAPGFRIVDGYSEIVRLGEGLAQAGRLSDDAMDRTLAALRVCAEKIAARPIAGMRCVATHACRGADNGLAFLRRVESETGLRLEMISPREEARLSVMGCAALIDPKAEAALVIDVGGGSTELSWVDAQARRRGSGRTPILAWASIPYGVVTLAERVGADLDQDETYNAIVREIAAAVAAIPTPAAAHAAFARGKAHFLGTSGTVTSLAGVLLELPRYRRALVDGMWLSVAETRAVAESLRRAGLAARAEHPCIGPRRADLVVPGGAILDAIFSVWPAQRIRVADRGLREGMLLTLMTGGRERSRVKAD